MNDNRLGAHLLTAAGAYCKGWMALQRVLVILVFTVLLLSSLALISLLSVGPFKFIVPVSSPINGESAFALAVLVILLLKHTRQPLHQPAAAFGIQGPPAKREAVTLVIVAFVVIAAFWRSLVFPFISDDYVHITRVLRPEPFFAAHLFTVSAGDRFFRPLGVLSYLLDAHWAATSPFRWHLSNLLFHVLNSMLVYILARHLDLGMLESGFAGIMFGIHGSRPEAVCWVATRFDLLATLFVLLSVLLFLRFNRTRRWPLLLGAIGACLCSLLSKESAYVLPFLLTLLFSRRWTPRGEGWRLLAPFYIVTLSVFLYRWYLVRGIGGYQDANTGTPTIFIFSFARTAKALLLRLWGILWFPINWTGQVEMYLALAYAFAIAVSVWLAATRRTHGPIMSSAAFVLIASIPVQHLLLISDDLEKSRVLYLPSVGFALAVAVALQSVCKPGSRLIMGGCLLVFQLAALQHNLGIWARVTAVAQHNCEAVASELRGDYHPALVKGLPKVLDGVYFMHNGFPECVEMYSQSRVTREQVRVVTETDKDGLPDVGTIVFVWDPGSIRLVRTR